MPEGDPIRMWLHQLRALARDKPLPGRLRINIGVTLDAASVLQRALRREVSAVEAVDAAGAKTYRIVLEGVMFEWLAPRQNNSR